MFSVGFATCGGEFLGFNDQNAQALMAIPFGLAWLVVGHVLWRDKGVGPAGGEKTHGMLARTDKSNSQALR